MAATYDNVDNCTTIQEDTQRYVSLPPNTKGYLVEKVETALKAPTHLVAKLKGGQTADVFLKQVVVSSAIRIDETLADFRWQYKAEVSFDMSLSIASRGKVAPRPFLSTSFKSGSPDPDRRHSLNPFPPGRQIGFLRRPDVIIVRNPALRWPGRAGTDHDGVAHPDNLLRLVEIKFPGDDWGREQERDYRTIAGGAGRMSVLDVSDCEGDLEKARQKVHDKRLAGALPPLVRPPERLRAPIRSVQPLRDPVWFEKWVLARGPDPAQATEIQGAIEALWNNAQRGAAEVSAESEAWLRRHTPWLFDGGRWTEEFGQYIYRYIDKNGREIEKALGHHIQAAWRQVQAYTDLTWEELKQVEWSQIGTFFGDHKAGIMACCLIVAGVVLIVVAAPAILAALAWLLSLAGAAEAAAISGVAALLTMQRMVH